MTEQRTVGQTLANVPLSDAVAYAGAALVIVGSLGTWVSAGIVSASGFSGDGKISVALALLAAFGVHRNWRSWTAVAFALALALGIYEVIHIHHAAAKDTLFGQQFITVGWGVYMVIAAAVVGLVGVRLHARP